MGAAVLGNDRLVRPAWCQHGATDVMTFPLRVFIQKIDVCRCAITRGDWKTCSISFLKKSLRLFVDAPHVGGGASNGSRNVGSRFGQMHPSRMNSIVIRTCSAATCCILEESNVFIAASGNPLEARIVILSLRSISSPAARTRLILPKRGVIVVFEPSITRRQMQESIKSI
jgi:hypothetical protein